MPVTIRSIDARIGEDVKQPIQFTADVDLSGWASWAFICYLYNARGTLLITCTAAAGTIVKTSTGNFYFWFKAALLAPLPTGAYFYQCRRADADNDTVLAEGPFVLKPYKEP